MSEETIFCNVSEGKVSNLKKLTETLLTFNGMVEVKIRKRRNYRSIYQNRLWWLYVTILSNEIGYTKEEMHEICKYKFLKKDKVDERTGEIYQFIGSTTELTRTEFAEMVDNVVRWASQTFGIVLPMPNEQTEIPINE